jgi:hypothetical protein
MTDEQNDSIAYASLSQHKNWPSRAHMTCQIPRAEVTFMKCACSANQHVRPTSIVLRIRSMCDTLCAYHTPRHACTMHAFPRGRICDYVRMFMQVSYTQRTYATGALRRFLPS